MWCTSGCGSREASTREGAAAPGDAAHAREAPFPDLTTPDPGADVELPELAPRTVLRPIRLLLDAGHGALDNAGNTSTYGVEEQEFTLDLAQDVRAELEATGWFEVRTSRAAGELTAYAARIDAARAMGADAFVSLHSDVRGAARSWSPLPGLETRAALDAPGFSVLFSDEGEAGLVARRRTLAAAIADSMRGAGFFPYGGAEYEGLYAADAACAGSFVDRHEDRKRIFVLRRTSIPSVIVETHNALDPREAARWDESFTRRAFALSLARALVAAVDSRATTSRD